MRAHRRILAPVDFSEATDAGLRPARRLAERLGAELFLLHVIEFPHESIATERFYLDVEEEATRRLGELADGLGLPGGSTHAVVRRGVPYDEITRFAEDQNIDMIVMPTHRRAGIDRLVFGSVTERVLRLAHCPVVAVPPTSADEFDPAAVLYATDFSSAGDSALTAACTMASVLDAEMTIAHVATLVARREEDGGWQFPMMPPVVEAAELARAEDELATRAEAARAQGLTVATRLLRGTSPALELAELAGQVGAGLIVVASHGHSGVTRALLGSTSEKLARISLVPVMVVRPAAD